jgi:polyhydroxybutyrate depolymerase
VTDLVPDIAGDGTTTTRTVWSGCDRQTVVQLLSIEGGGHTWPSSDPFLPERIVGRVSQDWGSNFIWEFFVSFDRG